MPDLSSTLRAAPCSLQLIVGPEGSINQNKVRTLRGFCPVRRGSRQRRRDENSFFILFKYQANTGLLGSSIVLKLLAGVLRIRSSKRHGSVMKRCRISRILGKMTTNSSA